MNVIPLSLHQRLNKLSHKAAKQLEGLYSIGHIDQHVLETVLDAGDLSQDTTRLPAFATSYLYLKSQHVPVADVINMAKQHQRRINLWWSASRWQDEHSRLSRFATLEKLSGENIKYDVSYFVSHLPEYFAGYLIGNSRRLGMEGLRQRHCIASWHNKLLKGDYAICVVFVNHVRWTVELIKTTSLESPVRIGQIKSRLNLNPGIKERKVIYALLGIKETMTSLESSQEIAENSWKVNATRILPVLTRLQVKEVLVQFSGSGDEGYVHDITFTPEVDVKTQVDVLQLKRRWQDEMWQVRGETISTSLYEAVEQMAYDYLELSGTDWYNDDGGQGELFIDMAGEKITLYVDVNYTECTREHDSETEFFELIEGELAA